MGDYSDYKVIFRAESGALGWEPGCPVTLEAVQVSRNVHTAEAYLQVKVRNVSSARVESLRCMATVKFADDTIRELTLEDLDLDLDPGRRKALRATTLPRGDAESVDITIAQVVQTGGKWRSSAEASALPPRAPLTLSAEASAERERRLAGAGMDPNAIHRAASFAMQDNGSWWICTCGQVNVNNAECCECGVRKSALVGSEDENELIASVKRRRESAYREATALKSKAINLPGRDKIAALEKAAELFRQAGEREDAIERAVACEAEIAEAKATATRKRTAKIRRAVIAVAVVTAVVVFAVFAKTQVDLAAQARENLKAAVGESLATAGSGVLANWTAAYAAVERLETINPSVEVGDAVRLGAYEQDGDASNGAEDIEWRILAVEGGRALLVSERGLDAHALNADVSKGNDWGSSDLKAWLEGDFKNAAFADIEQAVLDGDPFCLSAEEAEGYFSGDADRICEATPYAVSQGAYEGNDNACYWWLRSAGEDGDSAAIACYGGYVISFGFVRSFGLDVDNVNFAVRPALWVNLEF